MSTVLLNHVVVTANLPGFDGPFVLEVPTLDADTPTTRERASRRAMWALMAAGHFDPNDHQSPAQVLDDYFSTEYR